MGRTQRQRRIEQAANELQAHIEETNQAAAVAAIPDEQLFVIDRVGSKTAKKKLVKAQKQEKTQVVSKVEQVLLSRRQESGKASTQSHGGVLDLWGAEEAAVVKKKLTKPVAGAKKDAEKPKTKPVLSVPCHPGQSYHPSLDDHQEVLAEALAVETAILEQKAAEEQPFEAGFSEITKAVLMDGEDWVEEQEDENEEGEGTTVKRQKRKERLTTAEKNKRRRKNQEKFERQVELRKQSVNKGIDKLEKITKALEATEERHARQREIEQLIKSAVPEERVVPITPSTVATVPLSDELKGSLRTLKPKGNLLEEHVGRMATTKEVAEKKKKPKGRTRPHATKRIKLYEKYK